MNDFLPWAELFCVLMFAGYEMMWWLWLVPLTTFILLGFYAPKLGIAFLVVASAIVLVSAPFFLGFGLVFLAPIFVGLHGYLGGLLIRRIRGIRQTA